MAAEPLGAPTTGLAHPAIAHDWRRRVAHAFSRAAPRYAELASAQLSLGETLWSRLPQSATTVLDLGCGPGHWTARLSQRFGVPTLGLDLAPGMLAEAQRRHGDKAHWLCADAAALPIGSATVDLVFSNLAIQWCRDPAAVFAELYRILAPGGRALINTLGPGTLAEIAQAWAHAQRSAGIEPFREASSLCQAARQAGFTVQLDQATARFHYPDFADVMASVKGVGAQVAHAGARLTRSDLAHAARRYETLREPAGLPVSYRRLTLELEK